MKKFILSLLAVFILPSLAIAECANCREEIARQAKSMITDDSDLDTSAFTKYVYQKATGIEIPRTVELQKQEGGTINIPDIKKGDILFFNDYSFVGIYIGNDEFIYSNGRGEIKKRNIKSGYFKENLSGARSFIASDKPEEEKQKTKEIDKNEEEEELLKAYTASNDEPQKKSPKPSGDKYNEVKIKDHVLAPVPKGAKYKIGKPYTIKGNTYYPKAKYPFTQTGKATWYGPGLYGNQTANGEYITSTKLTAAHRTLPLPSVVEVTNLDNGKKVVVRVNDRGPFNKDKILDVSEKAAEILDVKKTGHAKVKIRLLKEETEKIWENSPEGKINWK